MTRREHSLGVRDTPKAENGPYVGSVDISTYVDVIERIWQTPSVVGTWLPGQYWDNIPRGLGADECWPWRGSVTPEGYAIFGEAKRYGTRYAHLLLWRHMHGAVPEGYEVDHSCWQRACMNPAHHRCITLAENRQNHDPARLTTHCPKGHPKDGDNLYVSPRGQRTCRECVREANRRYRQRAAS